MRLAAVIIRSNREDLIGMEFGRRSCVEQVKILFSLKRHAEKLLYAIPNVVRELNLGHLHTIPARNLGKPSLLSTTLPFPSLPMLLCNG